MFLSRCGHWATQRSLPFRVPKTSLRSSPGAVLLVEDARQLARRQGPGADWDRVPAARSGRCHRARRRVFRARSQIVAGCSRSQEHRRGDRPLVIWADQGQEIGEAISAQAQLMRAKAIFGTAHSIGAIRSRPHLAPARGRRVQLAAQGISPQARVYLAGRRQSEHCLGLHSAGRLTLLFSSAPLARVLGFGSGSKRLRRLCGAFRPSLA